MKEFTSRSNTPASRRAAAERDSSPPRGGIALYPPASSAFVNIPAAQGKFDLAQMAEEEELQGKFETTQMMEEEELQGKFIETKQLMEEEELQGKFETAQMMEEEELQGKFETAQMMEEEELQGKFETVQREPDQTGMPTGVRSQMETAMNTDFSDVRVHANSSRAPEVGALAYTQGSDIHFAPGQFQPDTTTGQQLLGHELTHVVQQREGRVQPTTEVAGLPVNDDPGLEQEADQMGRQIAR